MSSCLVCRHARRAKDSFPGSACCSLTFSIVEVHHVCLSFTALSGAVADEVESLPHHVQVKSGVESQNETVL